MSSKKNESSWIAIGLTGDVMIGRLVDEVTEVANPQSLWGDALPFLCATDLNVINLEAALTASEEKVPKVFNFKADPSKVDLLTAAHVAVANVANNHLLDYSVSGMRETLATLDRAGIRHVGAGETHQEACAPVILECRGVKIGILGCTDNEPSWASEGGKPGTFFVEIGQEEALLGAVEALRTQADFVLLSIHWGPNLRQRPSSEFIDFARRLVDLGVDLLHGHSAHLFQGVEAYHGGLILYDTGDFIDDYYVEPQLRNDRSFLFVVQANQKGVCRLEMIPILIADRQVHLAQGRDFEETCQRMQRLSQEFRTSLVLGTSTAVQPSVPCLYWDARP